MSRFLSGCYRVLAELASLEREADTRVYELYELPAAMRTLVEGEYAY